MKVPAIIVCPGDRTPWRVAGLEVLERLVIACHRAGCAPIWVLSKSPLPHLPRCDAWGVKPVRLDTPPGEVGQAVVMQGDWLFQAVDVAETIKSRGRLMDAAARPLPLGWVSSSRRPQEGGPSHLANLAPGSLVEPSLSGAPGVAAQGVAMPAGSGPESGEATRALWASITSSSDGFVDRWFNRPVGRILFSRPLIHTPVTPNQISVASILIGLAGAVLLARGGRGEAVAGALLFQLSAIVDCVDGDVARILFKESPLGKWLDLVGDQVVHTGIFIGIAAGLLRAGVEAPVVWLGASSVAGALISFAVILRGMLSPAAKPDDRLQKLVDGATSRDFSVLVLALACVGRLEIFLWMSAIGSHVFWIVALSLQSRRPVPAGSGDGGRSAA